ncbi:type 4a pilus biogenesis protein PilO [Vibrio scophthalmi]|uniref:Type IV pilus assembly protein PilO n=1 Tax=Vibrio scophthalmi LMG 19158 TaxID=870967 RepID=F9RRB8_9VIBR|nr:type 4a pilus biogenesis protein PilO [Vibrio scophthalmi]EGU33467.1 type IV pilus assembly protein PilO [Vibrio scophthalmi LMG 19158]
MIDYRELDIEELLQWPLSVQLLLLLTLIAVLQVGGYWWSIKGEMLQLTQLKQQEQSGLKSIQSKVSQLANKPHLLPQFDEVSQRYAELTHQFVQENELATMLAAVNEQGLQNNLTFSRIDWGKQESQAFYVRLPLEFELTGQYHDIGRFSQAIAALSPMINVVDVSWQRVSPASQKLHLRARAFSYQLTLPVNDEN